MCRGAGGVMLRVLGALVLVSNLAGGAPAHLAQETGWHDYYSVNGARLYVESTGHGSPVLFLHGGLMFFDNAYDKQRDYFAATHQVIGIDQRGHGHSPDGPWQLSYQQMSDDTAAVLRKLNVGRVDVVGHSDGGDIALLLARDHPELVRRVVISGANLRGWSPDVMEARRKLPANQTEENVKRLAASLPPFFATDYGNVTPDGPGHWMALVTKCYWMWGEPVVIDPAQLKTIQSKVLVVAGDRDFYSIEDTAEIFRGLPHAQLFVVPGSGHGTFTSRPALVNLAIREFFDQPDDPG